MASATLAVTTVGAATWASTTALVADVQGWVDAPATNAGWFVVGNETGTQTAVRFGSRENPSATARPQLRVRFRRTVAAEVGVLLLVGDVDLAEEDAVAGAASEEGGDLA